MDDDLNELMYWMGILKGLGTTDKLGLLREAQKNLKKLKDNIENEQRQQPAN